MTMKTIWVIGGPGCGKGTQCSKIIDKFGLLHLSSGDLLREEVASGSPRGASLQELMSKGLFVPTDVVLSLIKERMDKARGDGNIKGFLIDGYPRELEQGIQFEKDVNLSFEYPHQFFIYFIYLYILHICIYVCPVDLILFFDVKNETMKTRLLGRAAVSGRADDNEETIVKRIEIFNEKNSKIVEHYKDKVVKITAEGAVESIFDEASKALEPLFS
ncbi:GSCOCG00007333001-RA-CDS [Cotesia congregata]|nr:GSCOCG00007333001-RA-CDS [Cotesia congregata]